MSIGTRLFTYFRGTPVGQDQLGNRYFEERTGTPGRPKRRWVMYVREVEPTTVPPEWHAWLHHTTDAPLPLAARQPWQKPHQPNLTGTPEGYRPPGHDYIGGRPPARGEYEAWVPGS
ncbi:MAG: NADH:ubiquinone oxidoreductase subunit NDUFA12 [Thermohalobaculum sp.]